MKKLTLPGGPPKMPGGQGTGHLNPASVEAFGESPIAKSPVVKSPIAKPAKTEAFDPSPIAKSSTFIRSPFTKAK